MPLACSDGGISPGRMGEDWRYWPQPPSLQPPYTAVLPVREGRGTDHLDESVGSLLRLDPAPSELLFGIDEDSPGSLTDRLHSICARHSYARHRIVSVGHSARFGFQLGHVIWECILASSHDRILVSNADTSVLQPTIRGLQEVGPRAYAFVSLTERWPVNTPARLVRYARYRWKTARAAVAPYTGQFWSWRPAILDVLGEDDIARIRDGIDELVYDAVRESGRYEALTHKEIGSRVHGDTHYTVPWLQFKWGIHMAASVRGRLDVLGNGADAGPGGYRRFLLLPRPLRVPAARAAYGALVAWSSVSTWTPHTWRGYRWAMQHAGHPAVVAAASMGRREWGQSGAEHLGGVPLPGGGGGGGGTGWD